MSNRSLISQIPIDSLKEMVKNSFSFKELERKIGYQSLGGRINDIVRAFLEDNNIDYSHFYGVLSRREKRTFENSFCKHSTASSNYIKRYLLKNKIFEYQCSICGLSPIWNGKPLVLTLDHINGDHTDNRLENLRWVCPNCDRQLPTFGKRNTAYTKEQKRYCRNCGKELKSSTSRLCPGCAAEERRKVKRPDRDCLKKQIRTQSFLSIGEEYGVSDSAIRRWCTYYNLPCKKKDIMYYTNEEWENL